MQILHFLLSEAEMQAMVLNDHSFVLKGITVVLNVLHVDLEMIMPYSGPIMDGLCFCFVCFLIEIIVLQDYAQSDSNSYLYYVHEIKFQIQCLSCRLILEVCRFFSRQFNTMYISQPKPIIYRGLYINVQHELVRKSLLLCMKQRKFMIKEFEYSIIHLIHISVI